MLDIAIEDVIDLDVEVLAQRIENCGGSVGVTMRVADLYQAPTLRDIASNWLKCWYIAETLAESATVATCRCSGDERGVGHLAFEIATDNAQQLAEKLVDFAAVFDDDNAEAAALIYDEADSWLEARSDVPAWFPELEQNYRSELERAAAHEAEYPADMDDDWSE